MSSLSGHPKLLNELDVYNDFLLLICRLKKLREAVATIFPYMIRVNVEINNRLSYNLSFNTSQNCKRAEIWRNMSLWNFSVSVTEFKGKKRFSTYSIGTCSWTTLSGCSFPGLTTFIYQLQRNIRACNLGFLTTCRYAILNEQLYKEVWNWIYKNGTREEPERGGCSFSFPASLLFLVKLYPELSN